MDSNILMREKQKGGIADVPLIISGGGFVLFAEQDARVIYLNKVGVSISTKFRSVMCCLLKLGEKNIIIIIISIII